MSTFRNSHCHTQGDKRIRGRAGVKLRKQRLQRTHGLCEHCLAKGLVRPAAVVDHVQPLALGGVDVCENTRNLCLRHHAYVTAQQFGLKAPKRQISVDGWPEED